MPKLSLVIPCYNEEKTLGLCIGKVLGLKSAFLELELIIVDDHSSDKSLEIADALAARHPEVIVLRHDKNRGKGAALRTGFMRATGDYVGVQDADDEYSPLDYREMLIPMEQGLADVVYGSRYLMPGTRRVLYFWHTQMNRFLTFFSNMFTDLGITDMETCYKLFRREIIKDIAPRLREDRFGFEPEVTALVAEKRCPVYECAISYNPRTYDEGKKISWRDGIRALYCIMHYGAHRAPLPMQLLIYFFIGLVSAILNVCSFTLFIKYMSLLPAAVLSFSLAAVLNYVLCIFILFRHKSRWSAKGEIVAYILGVYAMCLLDYLCTAVFIGLGLSPFWAKSWSAVIGFVGNFWVRKSLVF